MSANLLTDRELITQLKCSTGDIHKALLKVLYLRYEDLIHKNWAILRKQMDNSSLVMNVKDDFYSESFIAMIKALEAIKLDKIKDDKWLFLGYFRLYLKNVRSDFIDKIMKTNRAEKSFYVETDDGEVPRIDFYTDVIDIEGHKFDPVEITERHMAEQRCMTAVAKCMSKWDDKRKDIFHKREQGISKSAIAASLNCHPATITYFLQSMKKDLEAELRM